MGNHFSNLYLLEKWESTICGNMIYHENVINFTDKQMAEDIIIFGLHMTDGKDLDEIDANFPEINIDFVRRFYKL